MCRAVLWSPRLSRGGTARREERGLYSFFASCRAGLAGPRKENPVRAKAFAPILFVLALALTAAPAFAAVPRTLLMEEFGWWY